MNIEKLPQSKHFLMWLFQKRLEDVEFFTPVTFIKENIQEKITGDMIFEDFKDKIAEGFIFEQASCLIKTDNFLIKAFFDTEPFRILNIKILNTIPTNCEDYKESEVFIRLKGIEELEEMLKTLYEKFRNE